MTDIEISLPDLDAWDAFAEANHDALAETYGSVESALKHAMDGGLTLGGGASPLVLVYFAEEPTRGIVAY